MKILVVEYVTGGGMCNENPPQGWLAEGDRMLRALLADLLRLQDPAISTVVFRDERLAIPIIDRRIDWVSIRSDVHFKERWATALAECDAVWPIAPESGGVLEAMCRDVENAGKRLMNSASAAIALTASKALTLQHLGALGIPVVPTFSLPVETTTAFVRGLVSKIPLPWIVKPDDGCGCEGIQVIESVETFPIPDEAQRWIAQPYLEGEPRSLSALMANGTGRLLSENRQQIERVADTLHLHGCEVMSVANPARQGLVDRIAAAIPGLWGYVGIDFLETETGPLILEINPRLTTSYVGIFPATGFNVAEAVLQLPPADRPLSREQVSTARAVGAE